MIDKFYSEIKFYPLSKDEVFKVCNDYGYCDQEGNETKEGKQIRRRNKRTQKIRSLLKYFIKFGNLITNPRYTKLDGFS